MSRYDDRLSTIAQDEEERERRGENQKIENRCDDDARLSRVVSRFMSDNIPSKKPATKHIDDMTWREREIHLWNQLYKW